ncbi:universal stress protein [Natronorubrum texcoconense]|uniref:Nucleotide-binding universal stress protein, UspA family n=1 Tax=Natronorubrum texcoconense TaxID=1095776 RepID=A0A1G8XQR4_9EURY|nr:universal stress protein [Natronorubrum texcoconense]SDJ92807.1 Nucleotide-binding universal stress protein, UspA family [Natronorubrum texcoconense]
MYDAILVATDGSETAAEAVEHAIELARQVDATLSAIAVLESRTEYDNAIVDPETVDRRRREQAAATLGEIVESGDDAGVQVETAIRNGVPSEEIVAYADEQAVDAIVIGARGRSSLRGALLGSTVDRVVRTAPQAVLVVGGDSSQ